MPYKFPEFPPKLSRKQKKKLAYIFRGTLKDYPKKQERIHQFDYYDEDGNPYCIQMVVYHNDFRISISKFGKNMTSSDIPIKYLTYFIGCFSDAKKFQQAVDKLSQDLNILYVGF